MNLTPTTQNSGKCGENNTQNRDIRDLDDPGLSDSGGRVAALRRWNATQPSIGQLPGEILSLVFQAACPRAVFGADKRGPPPIRVSDSLMHIALSQVCAFWRGVVQTTPQLWTHLTLYLNPGKFDHSVSLLLQSLNRSGDLPLDLTLHFSSDITIPINSLLREDIDTLLLKNFPRIQGLELFSPPTEWLSIASPPLGQLTTFSFGFDRGSQPLMLSNYPHLRHLQLTRVFIPILSQFPCQTITTLHLSTVPIDICAATLSQCPQLVDFQNRRPCCVWHRNAPLWPTERASFPNLKNFEWEILASDGDDTIWQSAMLNNIALPSLQSLRWIHPRWLSRPFPYEHTAGRFFNGLPATLTKVTFCGIQNSDLSDDYSEIMNRIRGDANVQQITFIGCNFELLREVIRSLEPQPGVQPRYPKLRNITIEFSPSIPLTTEHIQSSLHSLARMLEHRMDASRALFSIQLNRFPEFEWLRSAQRVLAHLNHCGFQLEILVDSKLVRPLA